MTDTHDLTSVLVADSVHSSSASRSGSSALTLQTTVDRRDFGITWDAPLPNGGSALADEVRITVDPALVGKD